MTFALSVLQDGVHGRKTCKDKEPPPELDAAIQSFASNLTEEDVALVSQKERSCFAQDLRNMTYDFSVFKDRYGEPVLFNSLP